MPVIRCVETVAGLSPTGCRNVPDVDKKEDLFAPGPMITEIEPETMEKLMALSPVLHINEAEAKNYAGREQVEDAVKDIFAKVRIPYLLHSEETEQCSMTEM